MDFYGFTVPFDSFEIQLTKQVQGITVKWMWELLADMAPNFSILKIALKKNKKEYSCNLTKKRFSYSCCFYLILRKKIVCVCVFVFFSRFCFVGIHNGLWWTEKFELVAV